ncbi:hypothetical protein [Rhizobium tubonense]|uniref:hypothetical protein n=1 Tax=Rhizobium tubonense TaxID=484088 RepID=UPI0018A80C0C|nr:hypothetical protein [Rhizobium tubonense]
MSNEVEHFLDTQDEVVSLMFLENKGDELTDILVAALEEALEILKFEISHTTFH